MASRVQQSFNELPALFEEHPVASLRASERETYSGRIAIENRSQPVRSLQQLVEGRAREWRDRAAVVFSCPDGRVEQVDYGTLHQRANQLAYHLRKLGVGPDVVVGICADRSLDMVVSVLAVIKAGGAYAALDPNYPRERLEFMIQDTQAPIILTQRKLLSSLPKCGATMLAVDSEWDLVAGNPTSNLPCCTKPEHLAYLIYTSGSTGKPKGVAMPQGPLINLLQWQQENFSSSPAARTLQFASLNFDVSFQEIFSTFAGGGALVLISEAERRDPTAMLRLIQAQRVERLFLPFVALKHLAEAAARENVWPSCLREVITAGEQLQATPAIVDFFTRLPECTLENQYGPSETHVVTAYRLVGKPNTWPKLPPIGGPVSNTRLHILDENRKPVAPGEPGELYIAGKCLARGYLNRPDLTAEKFVANTIEERETKDRTLYKTGDLARSLPDGNIEFLGRIDHQVKIRGYRVELGEVEATLAQHPQVREVVAMAADTANGDRQLVAYIVSRNGAPNSGELREFLRQTLPPQAIPALFVTLPKLPLTPNGKVDRKALKPPAEVQTTENSSPVKGPSDALEMQIHLAFEKFFQRRPIGVDVSFFELGGDSLQALKLVVEIERIAGRKISLNALYESDTVEKLARLIRQESGEEHFSSLVPLQPLGTRPPIFLVHTTPGDVLGYGNLTFHLGKDQPLYAFQSLGLQDVKTAHTQIEQMAAYYVKLMREVSPRGPYFIGGWCYGGLVAVEMAQQLRAAGETVGSLLLIETPAIAPSYSNVLYYMRRLGCLLNMNYRQFSLYLQKKLDYYRRVKTEDEMRYRRVSEEQGFTAEQAAERNKLLAHLEEIYRMNMDALSKYKSKFYRGTVTLFNAEEQDPAVVHDRLYGWFGQAAKIETHVIPGNHDTILMEPNVQILADKLRKSVDREVALPGTGVTQPVRMANCNR